MTPFCKFPLAQSLLDLWSTVDAGNCSYMRIATFQDSWVEQKRATFVLGKYGQFVKNAYATF
jgi:hypothetical protein